MGSFSIWHWLIVLVIVMLVFGTKKLRNIGADLGGAVRGFKDGMREGDKAAEARFKGEDKGFIYSRFSNPTVAMFEERMRLLEGAGAARATASGMVAGRLLARKLSARRVQIGFACVLIAVAISLPWL